MAGSAVAINDRSDIMRERDRLGVNGPQEQQARGDDFHFPEAPCSASRNCSLHVAVEGFAPHAARRFSVASLNIPRFLSATPSSKRTVASRGEAARAFCRNSRAFVQ